MRIAALIISLLFAACATATKPQYEEIPDDNPEEGLVSIQYLKSLANGRSTTINKDIYIEGFIIANDWLGEFYKTVIVADQSGGIEIEIDKKLLYLTVPMHAQIAISCNGLALGRVGSKVALGAKPTGEYATDRISADEIGRYIKISNNYEMPDPIELTIDKLSAEHISQFVCIRNLRIIDEEYGKTWCDPDKIADDDRFLTYTDRHFTDDDGNILTVRTLDRCEYGGEAIPHGKVTLAGVADYIDDSYALRIINHYIF